MIIAFFHCSVWIQSKAEASASTSASSKLPVIEIQKLTHLLLLKSSFSVHVLSGMI